MKRLSLARLAMFLLMLSPVRAIAAEINLVCKLTTSNGTILPNARLHVTPEKVTLSALGEETLTFSPGGQTFVRVSDEMIEFGRRYAAVFNVSRVTGALTVMREGKLEGSGQCEVGAKLPKKF